MSEGAAKRAIGGVFRRGAGFGFALTAVVLAANSLFLAAARDPGGLVGSMLQAHVVLGLAFAVWLLLFVGLHARAHWLDPNQAARRAGLRLAALLLLGCALGVILWWRGEAPEREGWVVAHQAVFVLGLVGYGFHRALAGRVPLGRLEQGGVVAVGLLLLAAGLWHLAAGPRQLANDLETQPTVLGATRAQTATGHWIPAEALATSEVCASCHPEVAAQWRSSAHRFSSLNDPFYAATFAKLQSARSPEATHFCGGCHDPVLLFSGRMNGEVTPTTPGADHGIPCLGCHGIVAVPDRKGNAGYVLASPQSYPYADSDDPEERELARRLVFRKPQQHREAMLQPALHRSAEFCAACHKAHVPAEVNLYRWKRGQNDYDPWHDSAAGAYSARTFYDPAEQTSCQDCHMPDVPSSDPAAQDGLIRDHGFPGANTALASHVGDEAWLRAADQMLRDAMSLDLLSVTVDAEERFLPLESPTLRLPASRPGVVEVVLRNRHAGHAFPAGTNDLSEVWLEVTLVGEDGSPQFASGCLDQKGRLDPGAHRMHKVLLTKTGERVDVHNVEDAYTLLYDRTVPLGASDVVRYALPPYESGEGVRLRARLLHRKFDRAYTEFALGPGAAALPVSEIASVEVALRYGIGRHAEVDDEDLGWRINDLGIASLRQGDLRTARWAFGQVEAGVSNQPDGPVNLARVHLADGALEEMEASLRRADAVRPGYWKTAFLLGELRLAQGRLGGAAVAFDRALVRFPRDRNLLTRRGSVALQQARLPEAVTFFERVLEIDPENVAAHTFLGQAHRQAGDAELATRHVGLAARFRQPREEAAVSLGYRRKHSAANREALAQHIHPLQEVADCVLPERIGGRASQHP